MCKNGKNASKHPKNQQNGAQNFLKSGNLVKILMPAFHIPLVLMILSASSYSFSVIDTPLYCVSLGHPVQRLCVHSMVIEAHLPSLPLLLLTRTLPLVGWHPCGWHQVARWRSLGNQGLKQSKIFFCLTLSLAQILHICTESFVPHCTQIHTKQQNMNGWNKQVKNL